MEPEESSPRRAHLAKYRYNRKGFRKFPSPICEHKDRPVFARGLCRSCYDKRRKRTAKELAKSEAKVKKAVETISKTALADIGKGGLVSAEKTAEALGYPTRNEIGREIVKRAQRSIDIALERAGITDDRLAQVAADGLQAETVKTASFEGKITDEKSYADWANRFRFWHDLLVLKGYLASDDENAAAPGGLMIINGPVQINTGHKSTCQCAECESAWNDVARKTLQAQRTHEAEMNLDDVPITLKAAPARSPQTTDSDDEDDWSEEQLNQHRSQARLPVRRVHRESAPPQSSDNDDWDD